MIPYDEPVYNFYRERVATKRYIDLHTTFGEGSITKTILV